MRQRRLADYGLNSERLLWPRTGPNAKGPGVFEKEVGDIEERLMLTTVE